MYYIDGDVPYVDDRILQYCSTNSTLVDGVLPDTCADPITVFEIPTASLLVERQLGCVVSFIEILQDSREDFRLFVGKVNAFTRRFEKLRPADISEVRGLAQDVFVGCEESLRWPYANRDDG